MIMSKEEYRKYLREYEEPEDPFEDTQEEKDLEDALDDFVIYDKIMEILEEGIRNKTILLIQEEGISNENGGNYKNKVLQVIKEKLESDPKTYFFGFEYNVFYSLFDDSGELERYIFNGHGSGFKIWEKETRRAEQENGCEYVELDDETYDNLCFIQSLYYLELLKQEFSSMKGEPEKYLEEYRETIRKALADKAAYYSAAENCRTPEGKPKE